MLTAVKRLSINLLTDDQLQAMDPEPPWYENNHRRGPLPSGSSAEKKCCPKPNNHELFIKRSTASSISVLTLSEKKTPTT